MLRYIIIVLFLLAIFVQAERVTLTDGDNYKKDDKNVTLIKSDRDADKALFCVNGITRILREREEKMINDVILDIRDVRSDRVILNIEYSCKGCTCDIGCDNSVCFKEGPKRKELLEQFEESRQGDTVVTISREKSAEDTVQPIRIPTVWIIMSILIIVLLLLGVILLWKI